MIHKTLWFSSLLFYFFFRNREKHLEERFYYTTEKAYFINKYFKYISYTYNILVSCILWHFDVRLNETIRKKTEYVVKTYLISTSLIEYRWWILLSFDIFSLNWKTSWWENLLIEFNFLNFPLFSLNFFSVLSFSKDTAVWFERYHKTVSNNCSVKSHPLKNFSKTTFHTITRCTKDFQKEN